MFTGTTRLSAFAVLIAQSIFASTVIIVGRFAAGVFRDFDTSIGLAAVTAIWLTKPAVLIMCAAVSIAVIVAAERIVQSEQRRLLVQIIDLCVWLLFGSFILVAIFLPLLRLFTALR